MKMDRRLAGGLLAAATLIAGGSVAASVAGVNMPLVGTLTSAHRAGPPDRTETREQPEASETPEAGERGEAAGTPEARDTPEAAETPEASESPEPAESPEAGEGSE